MQTMFVCNMRVDNGSVVTIVNSGAVDGEKYFQVLLFRLNFTFNIT